MKRYIILIMILSAMVNKTYSQGSDIKFFEASYYLSLNIQPVQTSITSENSGNILSSGKITIGSSISFGYLILRNIGFEIGLGLSSYSSDLTLNSYSKKFSTKDSENDSYEMQVKAAGIAENQKISYLDIPINIIYQQPITQSLGIQINAGFKFSLPLSKKYSSSGTFIYEGYYPSYNILLSNIPEYGFANEVNISKSSELQISSFTMSLLLNAGIYIKFSAKTALFLGVYYDKSLSNISKYNAEDFQLSKQKDEINSLMGNSSKTTTQGFGGQISIRYYLK